MNETSPFAMHTSYPKREFTANDMSSTLRDLQLAPSASLLVIPVSVFKFALFALIFAFFSFFACSLFLNKDE